jgi:hypothetical protein
LLTAHVRFRVEFAPVPVEKDEQIGRMGDSAAELSVMVTGLLPQLVNF